VTAAALLRASPYLEQAFLVLVVIGVVAFTVRRARGPSVEWSMGAAAERAILVLVLLAAILARTLWYDAPGTPRWYFAETTPLMVARAFAEGNLWRQWVGLLYRTQVVWVHESAVMMPVAIAFQALLGPAAPLPILCGAFWGVLAVLLAWAVGRAAHSRAFGLVFAAFVAGSPLQITWARLGGLQIGSSAHVLLALWLGYLAGARRSLLLTALAALVAWASVYHYYAARVGIPLAAVGLLAGLLAARARAGRALALVAAFALVFGALLAVVAQRTGVRDAVWPGYASYLGNRGEQTLGAVAAEIPDFVRRELPKATQAYFWRDRTWDAFGLLPTSVPPTARTWGMGSGGLCLLPVGLLGLVGLAITVRRLRRDFPWIALAGLGLLLPMLASTNARRLLVFDLGWCAMAAHGVLALTGARARSGPSRAGLAAATTIALALGAYAFATVIALDGALPPYQWAVIPFGDSGLGDGRTCLACVRTGRAWREPIEQGAFVVLFDSDVERENRTIPGGLSLYGKRAALAAGAEDRFLEYYAVVTNLDLELPRPGGMYDAAQTDFAAYLARRLEDARPARIVWYFAQPTQWERWLAERLAAAGGELRVLDDPSRVPRKLPEADPGLEVTTPWAQHAAALRIVEDVARGAEAETSCLRLETVASESEPLQPKLLAARAGTEPTSPPRWAVGSWKSVRYQGVDVSSADPAALAFDGAPGGLERLHVLSRGGHQAVYAPSTGKLSPIGPVPPGRVGIDCGALVGRDWWVVDPISGRLLTSARVSWPLPEGRWTGIAHDAAGRLVLASADQSLHVVDAADGREVARFPASVPPSRRFHFAECTPVLVGDGWIGTVDHLRSTLAVYDPHGAALGSVRLDQRLALDGNRVIAAQAAGPYVGLGILTDNTVRTLKVEVAPECSSPAAGDAVDRTPAVG